MCCSFVYRHATLERWRHYSSSQTILLSQTFLSFSQHNILWRCFTSWQWLRLFYLGVSDLDKNCWHKNEQSIVALFIISLTQLHTIFVVKACTGCVPSPEWSGSLAQWIASFCFRKRATNRSSFCGFQKQQSHKPTITKRRNSSKTNLQTFNFKPSTSNLQL